MNTNTIKTELKDYILSMINCWDNHSAEFLHQELFNTDYYIIGTYHAEQWLKKHSISGFEALSFIGRWEFDNFGEKDISKYMTDYDFDFEKIVNMITYIIGEELLYSMEEEIKLKHR